MEKSAIPLVVQFLEGGKGRGFKGYLDAQRTVARSTTPKMAADKDYYLSRQVHFQPCNRPRRRTQYR